MRPSPILSGILKRSSYYKPDYTQSAALIRARRPYLFKNAITGVCIASFAIGVFAFTLRAVGQEQFSDVIVPSGPPGPGTGAAADLNAPPRTVVPGAGPSVQPPLRREERVQS